MKQFTCWLIFWPAARRARQGAVARERPAVRGDERAALRYWNNDELSASLPRSARQILEGEGQLVSDLVAHYSRDANAARFGQCLQTCRNIDPVAEDVVLFNNHIAEIDADDIELAGPPNPAYLRENITAFRRLLDHNPRARIVWVHAGWDLTGERTVALMRSLLAAHRNLFMSVKSDPAGTPETAPFMHGGGLKPGWLTMLQAFPDRFVVGSDQFYDSPPIRRSTSFIFRTATRTVAQQSFQQRLCFVAPCRNLERLL